MPSSRSKVTASRGDPSPPSPFIAARNTEFGTCAAPDTSNGHPSADHAPDGPQVWRAQKRRGIDRFERELLILGVDQRLDVGERRARLNGDDQLGRFI